MQAVVRPHPLSNREQILTDIQFGMTIAETVDRLEMVDSKVRRANLAVLIDGETVPREFWHQRRLLLTDRKVEFAAVLHGGGGAKSILGTIAMIALTIYTGGLAAGAFGSIIEGGLSGTSLLVAKAGIMLVGSLLIHAIFAPPRTNPNSGDAASPTYSFSGQSNQPRKYATLPRIYGKHKYVADVAAMPYTTTVGPDQYLYAIYSFGYGPLKLEDFRIGANPLTNYTDYSVNIIENFTDPSQLKIYKNDVWQDSVSFELKAGAPVTVTTQLGAVSAGLDLSFPSGLASINNDGNFETLSTKMLFEYRALGAANWLPLEIQKYSHGAATTDVQFNMSANDAPGIPNTEDGRGVSSAGWPAGTNVFTGNVPFDKPPTAGMTLIMGYYTMEIQSVVDLGASTSIGGVIQHRYQITTTDGLPGNLTVAPGNDNLICVYKFFAPDSISSTGTNELNLNDKTQTSITVSLEFDFPATGQYEIRVTKTDADFQDTDRQHLWRRYITAVRTFKNVPPIQPEVPLTIVELSIKATGQLNGTIDQFSAVCSSVLRVWQDGAWVQQVTSNPAWIYLDILTGTANNRKLADSRIDMDAIRAWAVKCDEVTAPFVGPMGTCNVVVDRAYTVWELLQNIAATGRGSPAMKDNKYSILVDTDDRQPVQMFTPRNSRNVKVKRSYLDEPDAFRVKWIDALNDYQEAETVIYNTGKTLENTTVFEDIQAFGITRAEQALRWGRYMFAQAKLRQEHVTIETDIENIVCLRGDKVLLATDVLELGGMAVRIVDVEDQRVFVDAPSILPEQYSGVPGDYGVRIRGSDGYIGPVLDVTDIGTQEGLDYIDIAGDLTGIIADNLLVMGPKAEVVGEYVVDSISPGADLSATIGLEEYAPAVFTAEFTGIEQLVYTPQGGAMNAPGVDALTVTSRVVFDPAGRPMVYVRASWRRAQGINYKPDEYRVWQLTPDGKEQYLGATNDLYWELPGIDAEKLNGYTFIFRVRPYYGQLGIGPIAEASLNVVATAGQAPPLVDFFDVVDVGNGTGTRRYVWSFNGAVPEGVRGIQVRWLAGNVANPVWANGTDVISVGNYAIPTGYESHNPVGAGTFTFMARTIDAKNRLSTATYTLVKSTSATPTVDLTPPPTPTHFTAVGGHNVVILQVDQPLYTNGGGHQYTQIYAAKITTVQPNPTFANATAFTSFTDIIGAVAVDSATNYRFWAKWVSTNNTISQNPAGPVDAASSIDVAATVAALQGQISNSSLDVALSGRITNVEAKAATSPNLLPNGGFENGTAGWSLAGVPGTPTLTYPGQGPMCMWIAQPLNGTYAFSYDYVPVVGGLPYTLSMDSQMIPAGTGSVYCDMLFYDAAKTTLLLDGGQNVITQPHGLAADDTWRAQHAVTAVAPVNASYVVARIVFNGDFRGGSIGVRQVKLEWGSHFTPYSTETSLVEQRTAVNGLNAQWTVKIDTNGYVTGFGLASTVGNAAPSSTFAVRADSFYVANPTGPSVPASMPFIVRTTATVINGQNVPVGVYMQAAYIQNGTIDSAKIGLAVITDAHIASLNANKINAGLVSATFIDSRGLSIKDSLGNIIFSAGAAGINFETYGRTNLNYCPSFAHPWTIASDVNPITSGRGAGLQYSHDGWYLNLNRPTNVYELAQITLPPIPATNMLVSFYAYLNAALGNSRQVTIDLAPGSTGGSVLITDNNIRRYSILLPYDGTSSTNASIMRIIGYGTPGVPSTTGSSVIIFDVQLEINGVLTNWKPCYQDEPTPANPLTPGNIANFMVANTIATTYIADAAITNAKIGALAVLAANIADAQITTAKIIDAAITSAKIGALAVDTLKIADNAVTVPLGATRTSSIAIPTTGYTVMLETGYGVFPAGASVDAACVANMSVGGNGNVNGRLAAVCSDGTTFYSVVSVLFYTTLGVMPFASMFTLDRAGSWKFQLQLLSTVGNNSNDSCTISVLGVKK